MSLIIPDVAKTRVAKIWSGEVSAGTLQVKLFKNDYTPVASTVLADLTVADFTGYAAINLANPATQASLDAANRAVTLWDLVQWTKNGATGNTIYGYWVIDGGGNLLWVERFLTGGFALTADGAVLQFFPKVTWASQFSNS